MQSHGIVIRLDRQELLHNEKIYKLNPASDGSSAVDEEQLVEYVSFKLYTDYPVWGFVCSNNVLGYGGHVNRRPEFLNNVSRLEALLLEQLQEDQKISE